MRELFSPEVKDRAALPCWLHDAMSQAVASARGDQVPIVILHETGREHVKDYVVLRLGDFKDLCGEPGRKGRVRA